MKNSWRGLILWAEETWARLRARGAERSSHRAAVDQAVERAVEQANPRLRALMGYRKALYPVVEEGLAYCQELAAEIPGPVRIDVEAWSSDPQVNTLFANVDALRRVISGPAVRAWVRENLLAQDDCYGVLLAWPRLRTQLGTELSGDTLRRDVQQTTLGFADPEVALPASDPQEVRRQGAQAIMDALVGEAVRELTGQETRIAEVEERLRILRLKRKILNPAGCRMDFLHEGGAAHPEEDEVLGRRIAELERELETASAGLKTLDQYLARLVDLLSNPRDKLSIRRELVTLDGMNIVLESAPRDQAGGTPGEGLDQGPGAPREIELAIGYRGETRGRVLLLVRFPLAEMITVEERLAEVNRYLAT